MQEGKNTYFDLNNNNFFPTTQQAHESIERRVRTFRWTCIATQSVYVQDNKYSSAANQTTWFVTSVKLLLRHTQTNERFPQATSPTERAKHAINNTDACYQPDAGLSVCSVSEAQAVGASSDIATTASV